ncbi:SgcJ/EcaC family oxidoreductase [Occultella kanbiaonis]|uniref:SgcJ/EcaC family oxidoreductase n=1 Tax=Occultella kanbiaonis TaxID=2675754 RepID=UPI0013D1C386|nr:SgcJ/EcaC family oxidoreductase [Occultella kanbiaonis]
MSQTSHTNAEPDLAGLDEYFADLREAWASGDARRYADLFTQDATYVIFAGIASVGRDAIARDHEPVLTKWQRGTRMSMNVLERRVLAPGVVSVLTEGGIGKGARLPLDKLQTFTLVRTADGWRCAAFQNTKRNRLFVAMNARAMRKLKGRG